jgi:hypothetical protein
VVAILGVAAEIIGLRLRMYQNFEIRQNIDLRKNSEAWFDNPGA